MFDPANDGPGAPLPAMTKSPPSAFNEWALLVHAIDIEGGDMPPARVRLSDWHVGEVLRAGVSVKKRATYWSSDFDARGMIRPTRPARGPAHKTKGQDGKCYYTHAHGMRLIGDEGVLEGVEIRVGQSGSTVLAIRQLMGPPPQWLVEYYKTINESRRAVTVSPATPFNAFA